MTRFLFFFAAKVKMNQICRQSKVPLLVIPKHPQIYLIQGFRDGDESMMNWYRSFNIDHTLLIYRSKKNEQFFVIKKMYKNPQKPSEFNIKKTMSNFCFFALDTFSFKSK